MPRYAVSPALATWCFVQIKFIREHLQVRALAGPSSHGKPYADAAYEAAHRRDLEPRVACDPRQILDRLVGGTSALNGLVQ